MTDIKANSQIAKLRAWINNRPTAVFLTSHFSLAMLHYGKSKLGDRYGIDYLKFADLFSECDPSSLSLDYFTSHRQTPNNPNSAPEIALINWMGKNGYNITKRAQKGVIRNTGDVTKVNFYTLPFSTDMAFKASEYVKDIDAFIILDTIPETGFVVEWLRLKEKIVICGDLSAVPNRVDQDAKGNANAVIDFSDPEIISFLQRTNFKNQQPETLFEEDDDTAGVARVLAR